MEKSGVLEHKSGNISEMLKDRWKVTVEGLPTLFRTVPPRPPLPQDWGFATPPKTSINIISGMGKATNVIFGWYFHRVHPNKSPFKILEKRSVGVSIEWVYNFHGLLFRWTLWMYECTLLNVSAIGSGMVPFDRALVSSYRPSILTFYRAMLAQSAVMRQ